MSTVQSKRDAVFDMLEGRQPTGYVPAGFFLHFGSQYHTGSAAIEKHKEFFSFTGMDIVKIQFELPWPQFSPAKPADWSSVPVIGDEFFEPQLEVVRGLVKALKSEAPVLLTLYSPFMIAAKLAAPGVLNRHLEEDRTQAAKGIEIVTDTLMRFMNSAISAGLDGFYHSTQGGESKRFSDPSIFIDAVKPYDLAYMNLAKEKCALNILHICDYHKSEYGEYESAEAFLDYPGHIVNSSLIFNGRRTTPTELSRLFGRPFMGGVERIGTIATGTEDQARAAARNALDERSERFMLAADCTVPGDTPWENLRAAIDEAHRG